MSTNKKSYPTTMGWRELVNIYREFGDNAQQCVDFVINNIQPKADGYRMGFTQSPLRIFNKMVKFKPDGVYILYEDGHNEKFDEHNGKAGVRAIGLSHGTHCFGIALKDAGEYKLMNREKALKTLRHYNKWRRDNHIPNKIPMPDPKEVGEAIDVAIRTLRMCRALDRVVECYDELNRVANENRPY